MNFIERWFGLYPDGGSGLLEAIYLLVIALAVAATTAWRARRRPADE